MTRRMYVSSAATYWLGAMENMRPDVLLDIPPRRVSWRVVEVLPRHDGFERALLEEVT